MSLKNCPIIISAAQFTQPKVENLSQQELVGKKFNVLHNYETGLNILKINEYENCGINQ